MRNFYKQQGFHFQVVFIEVKFRGMRLYVSPQIGRHILLTHIVPGILAKSRESYREGF